MGSRLGRRVIHFANLPIKLLLPNPPFDSIQEFALKTIPSASKIEIRRVLESLYGFEVEDVRTLNMEGKKKKRGGYLTAKPDYKKAYITLRSPLSLSPDLFPIPWIEEARERVGKSKKTAVVEDPDSGKARTHWLDDSDRRRDGGGDRGRKYGGGGGSGGGGGERKGKGRGGTKKEEESKFPWSSMRSWR